VKPGERF